jgi:hypothetical protein
MNNALLSMAKMGVCREKPRKATPEANLGGFSYLGGGLLGLVVWPFALGALLLLARHNFLVHHFGDTANADVRGCTM